MKIYNFVDGELIEPRDIEELEGAVRKLEADERPLACRVEVEGAAGSTLLNVTLPDFTQTEELTLLRIFNAACERTARECADSIKLCNQKLADLQGFKMITGQKGKTGDQV